VLPFVLALLTAARVFFRSRTEIALEVLALRQQLSLLKRKRARPRLNAPDRLFWTMLRQTWSRWKDVLVIVKPETVVGWHRAGFRLYWRWRSWPRGGRSRISQEIRVLIRRLAQENPGWGAPKIHGEFEKLGLVVSETTVARYLRRALRRGDPAKRWLAFLRNHREAIAGLDFLHRADGDVSRVVLRLRRRTRTPPDPALQRHATPVGRVGRAAVARSFSGNRFLSLCHPGSRLDLLR
jgi:hypothetical protein